jgi:hypothetical protein
MINLNETAPEGQVFVCGACGKSAKRRVDVGDESCWLHSVLCYEDGIIRNERGLIVSAKAVSK